MSFCFLDIKRVIQQEIGMTLMVDSKSKNSEREEEEDYLRPIRHQNTGPIEPVL